MAHDMKYLPIAYTICLLCLFIILLTNKSIDTSDHVKIRKL